MKSLTAQQLYAFMTPVRAHWQDGAEITETMWLLLQSGDTIVIPGADWEHYDNHSEWPVLLMTGPDPDWMLQWWIDGEPAGGDEGVVQRDEALARAEAGNDAAWIAACQRAITEYFAPFFDDPTEAA